MLVFYGTQCYNSNGKRICAECDLVSCLFARESVFIKGLKSTMKKFRVAVIGCGNISVMHFASIAMTESCELVACCDIKEERARKWAEKYGVVYYTDYNEMFDKEALDAVHLCLPHYIHSKVSIEAMERGINVLCEKPMDVSYEAAELAVKRAEELGVQFGIISQCRYHDSSRFVKERISSGKLGKIISVASSLTWVRHDDYYKSSDWKGTWDKEGGGVIINQAIHTLDLVRWIVDSEAKEISCSMSNRAHPSVEVEDSSEGLITFENGVRYGFWCMNNYGINENIEIRIHCERGEVRLGYNDAYITYSDGTKEEAHNQEEEECCGLGMDYWGIKHVRQIRQYYSALAGCEELEISGREALKTHKMIMDIYDSAGMKSAFLKK